MNDAMLRALIQLVPTIKEAMDSADEENAAEKAIEQTTEPAKEQKRCGACKKKLCLSDFACAKCTTRYCGAHRLPETHACPHDFKKEGQTLLTKQNPRVVADKVDRI
jgi:predicted nucleic acid binding AN1-type Zn finger protein